MDKVDKVLESEEEELDGLDEEEEFGSQMSAIGTVKHSCASDGLFHKSTIVGSST